MALTLSGNYNLSGNRSVANAPAQTYSLVSGTKAPILGAGGQATFPAVGWTAIISASADDANSALSLPFPWYFNGTAYTTVYPGSNFYFTFGAGSTVYSSLGATNPPYNKIMIAAADNSWQRTSSIASGTNYIRYRQEGNNTTTGTVGSPTMVYEATFFNMTLTGGRPWIEILMGSQSQTGLSGIYSSNALLAGGTMRASNVGLLANQSYVLVGDPLGISWTVYTGYYVGGTDY